MVAKESPLTKEQIVALLEQAAVLVSKVTANGVLDTTEVYCTSCPHKPHKFRNNLRETKARTELTGALQKLYKWANELKKPPETADAQAEEGTDDGHQ